MDTLTQVIKFAAGNAGHCSPSDLEFIRDIKLVLKGSGFALERRARNPNRKQFVGLPCGEYHYGHRMLRQSMPLRSPPAMVSTSFRPVGQGSGGWWHRGVG